MSRPAGAIWYLYGVVPASFDLAGAPSGLDQAPLALEEGPGAARALAALVSVHEGEKYAPEVLERSSADVEWLGPRARAHDEVLTWASDRGAVIPMPMFTLFSSREAVLTMLRDREPQLLAALARTATGREYALRVYRIDSELLETLETTSPRLRELRESARTATPGQRYLLERKLETERKAEARLASQRVADEIFDALVPHAVAATRNPIAGGNTGAAGTLVLDSSFLVSGDCWHDFQTALTDRLGAHRGRGFRFDFTGPWPPYHFVSGAAAEPTDVS